MTLRFSPRCLLGLTLATLGSTSVFAAQEARDRDTAKQPAASSSTARASGARSPAKGTLPDPVLLDGSTQPAEKRPEHGMIGDFELPGDENVRNGKVGGPQGPQGPQGQQQQGGQQGMMAGMPSGGGGQQSEQQNQQQQGGGQQQQGEGSGNAPSGPQDPNAKAEGTQVAQLETDPSASQSGGEAGQKPQPVAIGDKAMQIKTVSNPSTVVGAQQQASTAQQMEKQVGGGKGASAVTGGRNAAEKGRAIPAGL